MPSDKVLKLYNHFISTADVNKYHGNVLVLKKFMRMTESELREAINKIQQEYQVKIFWFSDKDFIVDLTDKQDNNFPD